MVDVHCHLLYGVDDGAETMEESVSMLREAKNQGIESVILTPHYRHGMFAYPKEKIEEHYLQLKPYAEETEVALFLGTEYHVNSRMVEAFRTERCRTLAGSSYVLTEYSHDSEFTFIEQMTEELVRNGYIPILAHVERYACMTQNLDCADRIRQLGGWIQLNADAVLGMDGMSMKRFCRKMLGEELVDVVASDSHGIKRRACHMARCFDKITKKYSRSYAERLMTRNPLKILENAGI